MKVTVFGGAQPKEGSAAYEEARELGRLLAERGHAVLTAATSARWKPSPAEHPRRADMSSA